MKVNDLTSQKINLAKNSVKMKLPSVSVHGNENSTLYLALNFMMHTIKYILRTVWEKVQQHDEIHRSYIFRSYEHPVIA